MTKIREKSSEVKYDDQKDKLKHTQVTQFEHRPAGEWGEGTREPALV